MSVESDIHHTRVLILHATNSETNIQSRWQTGDSLFFLLRITHVWNPSYNVCRPPLTGSEHMCENWHFLSLSLTLSVSLHSGEIKGFRHCTVRQPSGSRFDPKTRIHNLPLSHGAFFPVAILTPDNKRVNFLGVVSLTSQPISDAPLTTTTTGGQAYVQCSSMGRARWNSAHVHRFKHWSRPHRTVVQNRPKVKKNKVYKIFHCYFSCFFSIGMQYSKIVY